MMRMFRAMFESLGLHDKGGKSDLKFPDQPNPAQFKHWRNTTRTSIISHLPKRAYEVLRWLLKIEQDSMTFVLLEDSEGFAALDMEVAAAGVRIVKGELGRSINIVIDDRAKQGLLTKGRQVLFMIYEFFRQSDENGAMYDLADLMKVKYLGEDKLPELELNWDLVVSGCGDEPIDERSCRTLLLEELRKSAALKLDIAYYDRLPKGHEDKSYTFLKTCLRRCVERMRLNFNRRAHDRAIGPGGAPVEDNQAIATGMAAAGKGDGKGKGKTAKKELVDPPPTGTAASEDSRPCRFWGKGTCHYGVLCPFKHEGKGNCSDKLKEPPNKQNETTAPKAPAVRATVPISSSFGRGAGANAADGSSDKEGEVSANEKMFAAALKIGKIQF